MTTSLFEGAQKVAQLFVHGSCTKWPKSGVTFLTHISKNTFQVFRHSAYSKHI